MIDELSSLLENSRRVVVFTGAGISTESGIPDFRSPGGFWSNNQPIYFKDFLAWEDMRREAWRRKLAFEEAFKQAQPNRGHRAIAHLLSQGKCASVITQNIDGLHQQSGVPDDKVIELHGNSTYAVCLGCARRFELAPILAKFSIDEQPPECECGGFIKTATISFGQPMPLEAMQDAKRETEACDLFLAVGSSLVVYPAAGFPALAKERGARLVIVNRDPTDLDYLADLVLNTEIGETLGAVTGIE
ncbi:MAG TPA: Sir2 family NAD-dependent protein deacetylase [Blastocatellia bacterium]|nr:Sir2 family NAD-dependent protein deacetylase [Blastocatellia bacterium]